MAVYPIKMLKDEGNNPFVPLVGTNAIVDAQGQSLDDKFATKLEAVNIIAGENITLQKVGNNITINGGAGSSVSLIDNLTTATPGLGALDARQGKALKDLIPAVINNLNSTSTTSALSAYQGYLLKNRVVPAGGTTGQVLKKSSNADNAVEWGDNITVENNLTSTSTTNALSAAQGKTLKDTLDFRGCSAVFYMSDTSQSISSRTSTVVKFNSTYYNDNDYFSLQNDGSIKVLCDASRVLVTFSVRASVGCAKYYYLSSNIDSDITNASCDPNDEVTNGTGILRVERNGTITLRTYAFDDTSIKGYDPAWCGIKITILK